MELRGSGDEAILLPVSALSSYNMPLTGHIVYLEASFCYFPNLLVQSVAHTQTTCRGRHFSCDQRWYSIQALSAKGWNVLRETRTGQYSCSSYIVKLSIQCQNITGGVILPSGPHTPNVPEKILWYSPIPTTTVPHSLQMVTPERELNMQAVYSWQWWVCQRLDDCTWKEYTLVRVTRTLLSYQLSVAVLEHSEKQVTSQYAVLLVYSNSEADG